MKLIVISIIIMIKITIYQNHSRQYLGFCCNGHAEYAEYGEDIVCAAVSVLVLNTLNAIEAFTSEKFDSRTEQKNGLIDIRFRQPAGHDAELLLKTMVLGLQDIQRNYGTDYSFLLFKEV